MKTDAQGRLTIPYNLLSRSNLKNTNTVAICYCDPHCFKLVKESDLNKDDKVIDIVSIDGHHRIYTKLLFLKGFFIKSSNIKNISIYLQNGSIYVTFEAAFE